MKTINFKNSDRKITIGKIVCVGRNYADHAKEMGSDIPKQPMIFLKTSTCVINSGEKVVCPSYSNNLHYEGELVLLIGKTIKDADETEAKSAIAAYGAGLDMTLRDLQNEFKNKGNPWTLAKVFDTSAVVSDFVLKENLSLNGKERIWLKVNGEMKQNSSISNMIFSCIDLVKFISSRMTLEEGDLIFTGTPEGVGRVENGDIIEAGVEGIAELKATVVSRNND